MLHLRKTTRALREGSYRTDSDAPADCLVFHREIADEDVIVALNFSSSPRRLDLPRATVLLSSSHTRADGTVDGPLYLSPNEGIIVRVLLPTCHDEIG